LQTENNQKEKTKSVKNLEKYEWCNDGDFLAICKIWHTNVAFENVYVYIFL
jgi:hypothetical protein